MLRRCVYSVGLFDNRIRFMGILLIPVLKWYIPSLLEINIQINHCSSTVALSNKLIPFGGGGNREFAHLFHFQVTLGQFN